MADPTSTDPDKYSVVFENDLVRVLEYRDQPGQKTSPHEHPNSVMHTLSSFRRRLIAASGESRDVSLAQGETRGENIGETPTHVLFVELKESAPRTGEAPLGPA
jgi:beta-alanine degradation protein BauB